MDRRDRLEQLANRARSLRAELGRGVSTWDLVEAECLSGNTLTKSTKCAGVPEANEQPPAPGPGFFRKATAAKVEESPTVEANWQGHIGMQGLVNLTLERVELSPRFAKAIATRRRLVLRCSIPHANGQDVVLAACERRCEGILSCRHSSRHWLQPQDEQPLVQLLASHACLSMDDDPNLVVTASGQIPWLLLQEAIGGPVRVPLLAAAGPHQQPTEVGFVVVRTHRAQEDRDASGASAVHLKVVLEEMQMQRLGVHVVAKLGPDQEVMVHVKEQDSSRPQVAHLGLTVVTEKPCWCVDAKQLVSGPVPEKLFFQIWRNQELLGLAGLPIPTLDAAAIDNLSFGCAEILSAAFNATATDTGEVVGTMRAKLFAETVPSMPRPCAVPERVLPAKTPEKTVEMPAQRPADLSAVLDRIFEVVRASQVAPERAFAVLDSDGDGVVAAQDMLGLLHHLGLPLKQELDLSGVLDGAQFERCYYAWLQSHPEATPFNVLPERRCELPLLPDFILFAFLGSSKAAWSIFCQCLGASANTEGVGHGSYRDFRRLIATMNELPLQRKAAQERDAIRRDLRSILELVELPGVQDGRMASAMDCLRETKQTLKSRVTLGGLKEFLSRLRLPSHIAGLLLQWQEVISSRLCDSGLSEPSEFTYNSLFSLLRFSRSLVQSHLDGLFGAVLLAGIDLERALGFALRRPTQTLGIEELGDALTADLKQVDPKDVLLALDPRNLNQIFAPDLVHGYEKFRTKFERLLTTMAGSQAVFRAKQTETRDGPERRIQAERA